MAELDTPSAELAIVGGDETLAQRAGKLADERALRGLPRGAPRKRPGTRLRRNDPATCHRDLSEAVGAGPAPGL